VKLRLSVDEKHKEILKAFFENMDIEINDLDFDYTLISGESDPDLITGYHADEIFLIRPKDVVYFESDGNDITCHTINLSCRVKYRLYEIESLYRHQRFMRVSSSSIVNLDQIRSIKPTINSKFVLTMKNKDHVDVTRSYYHIFKNYIEGGGKE